MAGTLEMLTPKRAYNHRIRKKYTIYPQKKKLTRKKSENEGKMWSFNRIPRYIMGRSASVEAPLKRLPIHAKSTISVNRNTAGRTLEGFSYFRIRKHPMTTESNPGLKASSE
jgi:hypothetical protein